MRIAVAMSGGMDSTASALLLKREGHEVIGLHMRLHSSSSVTWSAARKAAEEIGVPIHLVDLSKEFSDFVVTPFLGEYARGFTPSPCPICNRRIKMGLLFEHARQIGCEALATGHYARVRTGAHGTSLLKGKDLSKDQSYFLFNLTGEMLNRTVFPLGEFTKSEIREILRQESISVAESEESQELCFIPGRDYRSFLQEMGIPQRPGAILNTQGRILGSHKGIANFTVGQRRGIGVCAPRPLYVIRIDARENAVIVGFKEETLRSSLRIQGVNLLPSFQPSRGDRFHVKVRSTSRAVACTVTENTGTVLELEFDEPQSGIAPGQAGVLYADDRVAGGGWISGGAFSARVPTRESGNLF
jgi:tRNA-uridine 2-sulfurtransferase